MSLLFMQIYLNIQLETTCATLLETYLDFLLTVKWNWIRLGPA